MIATIVRVQHSSPSGISRGGREERLMTDFDFALGEMADLIREMVQRFAADRIAPLAKRIDAEDWFPRDLWPEMGALGLHGITVEEADGGLGLGYLEHVVAQEEIARALGSVGLSYGAHF